MSNEVDLKELERRAFRSTFQDGIWDIFIGLAVLQFVFILFLNDLGLGDFWSSFAVLPVYIIALFLLRIGKKYITTPRVGIVKYGQARKKKLKKIIVICNIVLLIGLFAGLLSYVLFDKISSKWIFPMFFSITILLGFSLGAYFLDFTRLYVYGFLVSISIPVGELLYKYAGASHHGFPIVFGISGGSILIIGIAHFINFLKKYPKYNENVV